jgi:ribosomal protein S18 acetylase RimI-like enzyme
VEIKLNTNNFEDIDEALLVSKKVFKPTPEDVETYHNKQDWLKKLENNGLLIVARVHESIIGYAVCYSRDYKFHIWNVGVLEEFRKSGIWNQMYETIIKFAKQKGFNQLTINTYKDRFPNMYIFCLKHGFEEFNSEKGKSFFIKNI